MPTTRPGSVVNTPPVPTRPVVSTRPTREESLFQERRNRNRRRLLGGVTTVIVQVQTSGNQGIIGSAATSPASAAQFASGSSTGASGAAGAAASGGMGAAGTALLAVGCVGLFGALAAVGTYRNRNRAGLNGAAGGSQVNQAAIDINNPGIQGADIDDQTDVL